MDLKLSVFFEVEGEARTYDLEFAQDVISIGRHSRNDVQIPDMQVSAEHARLLVEGRDLFLIDHGSGSGTLVNGVPADPGVRLPVEDGAELRIASYRILVGRSGHEVDETSSEKTAMVAMNMVREVLGMFAETEEAPVLEVLNDKEKGTRLELPDETGHYTIGRQKKSDLILKHWSISRAHAVVRRGGREITIEDLGSKNGVMVNGERLEGARKLKPGDKVSVGHTELEFSDPAGNLLDSMDGIPTPITDLKDLGLDLDALRSGESPEPEPEPTPPEPTREVAPPPDPRPEPEPPRKVTLREREEETSFADYLPIIVGVLLLLGAAVAAVVLFVL